jgi:hypothetical protein
MMKACSECDDPNCAGGCVLRAPKPVEPCSAEPSKRAAEVVEDMDNLRHMLGAKSTDKMRDWGYRNYYCANVGDKSMERLAQQGLVQKGAASKDQAYWHATEAGCKAIGFTAKQIKKAFSRV